MGKLIPNKLTLRKAPFSIRNIKWSIQNNFSWGCDGMEQHFSFMMEERKLFRVDTLGKNDTNIAFSLHPVIKPDQYVQAIPDLLKRIDADDIPDSQRGYYNVCDDLFDFTKFRKKKLLSW
jgi:hypothetical protein